MAIENSVNYALRIIKPVLDGHGTIVELKKSAEKSYVQRVQNALTRTVFGENCQSWYQRGSDGKTWNGMTYPWSQFHYWYRSFFPSWSDLQYRVGFAPREFQYVRKVKADMTIGPSQNPATKPAHPQACLPRRCSAVCRVHPRQAANFEVGRGCAGHSAHTGQKPLVRYPS